MLELNKTYKTKFATGELFTVTEINKNSTGKITSIYGVYENNPLIKRCLINLDRLIIEEEKENNYNDLPKHLQEALLQKHTHAELLNPNEIVYTEKSVLEIIKLINNKKF